MRARFWILIVLIGTSSLWAEPSNAEAPHESAQDRVQGWLKQFENSNDGELPDTFCVRISLEGYLTRESKEGMYFFRPREVYEFTPKEVRRLCIRAAGVDEDGDLTYRTDKQGLPVYEVAGKKPFTKIGDVCRDLLALDFVNLTRPAQDKPMLGQTMVGISLGILFIIMAVLLVRARMRRQWLQFSMSLMMLMSLVASIGVGGGVLWYRTSYHGDGLHKNFHHLQVMTDSGLPPMGGAEIQVGAAGAEVSYLESCVEPGSPSSEDSIRFAALYHTLRRMARSTLDLSDDDWRDAFEIIDVDGSVKPAKVKFRARE